MLRLQNNTPSNYVDGSRDFQLFLRLFDCLNNGVKFDIDTITNCNDPIVINDRVLSLLCSKVGFFPKNDYDTKLLRYILESFSYLVKLKGTRLGIEGAVNTILKIEDNRAICNVDINNDDHTIEIYTSTTLYNKKALGELLGYILPPGYSYNIGTYQPTEILQDVPTNIKIDTLIGPSISVSQVRGSDRVLGGSTVFDFTDNLQNDYVGSSATSIVVSSDNLKVSDSDQFTQERNNTDKADNFKTGEGN